MKKNGIASYLSNLRLVFFGYIVVIAVGLMAWFTLPREEMPQVDLPVALVSTVLPGANPQDVEQLVTVPLEDNIRGINGIDYVRATSMENASVIIIMFKDGVDADDAVQKVREKVDATSLPDDANKPNVVKMDFDELAVWTFAIAGDDKVSLVHVADEIKKELEREALIDRVEITGTQEREIVVHMNQADITKYGVNPAALASAVAAATTNVPAGSVNLGNFSYSVSLNKEVSNIEELRQMAVILNGVEYQLGDIADIYEQEKPGNANSYQVTNDGDINQVVTLNVYKTAGSAIDATADTAHAVVASVMDKYPQYTLTNITDSGQEIEDTFSDLYENIIETIVLVFVVMFVFLGIREATISSISIPIVMLVTFGVMMAFGLTLNFITLFGLLIALGMLVDNAIVVVTALSRSYFERQDQGVTALQAGVDVWKEFFVALISTNLTTIWAFLPLLLVSGIMGKFISPVGLVVTAAMLASALVAFLLTLPLGVYVLEPRVPVRVQKMLVVLVLAAVSAAEVYFLPRSWLLVPIVLLSWVLLYLLTGMVMRRIHRRQTAKNTNKKRNFLVKVIQDGFISTEWLENGYKKIVSSVIATRKTSVMVLAAIIILTVLSFVLPFTGYVHSEFFPKEEADYFDLVLTLPVGTNVDEADRVARELLPRLAEGVEDLEYITAQVGRSGSSSLVSAGGDSNSVLFTFNLVPEKKRHSSSVVTAKKVRERWENNEYGKIVVNESSTVSAGGADIQMYLVGDDMDILAAKAEEMVAWLKSQPGVVDVESTMDDTSKRLVFRPNDQLVTDYGLTSSSLGLWLRSTLSGWKLGSLRLDGKDKDSDITLRQQVGTPAIESLAKIQVPISGVGYVPLDSLGTISVEPNLAQISRYNYAHSVGVTASVLGGYSSTEINQRFEQFIDTDLNLPTGYSRTVAGVQSMNNDAMSDLGVAMVVALLLITITLVIQLRSFRKAFIVMSVIPVAISGVFINFAILGWSLSLPSVVGILALFGIVVNNSILIIERINQNLDEGRPFTESVVEGCVSRLQPILLTSLTTIFGLLPITLSDPLWQGLGGTIICGLTFSGVLLLFFIPALFVLIFEPAHRQKSDARWQRFVQSLAE